MAQLNIEVLTPIAASVSPETIRARRKRIYRKLGVAGATETLSLLLAESLAQLASTPRKRLQISQQPQGQRRPDQTDGSASALGVEAADAAGVRLALGRAALASSKQDHHVRVEHG